MSSNRHLRQQLAEAQAKVDKYERDLVMADAAMAEGALSASLCERLLKALCDGHEWSHLCCDGYRHHDPDCEVAKLMRAIGGEPERQRQVNQAHVAQVAYEMTASEDSIGGVTWRRYPRTLAPPSLERSPTILAPDDVGLIKTVPW